jgi:predicted DNA-binding protein with PD1-like motif
MRSKLIDDGPQKTYVLVLESGDEVASSVERFAVERGLSATQITCIGLALIVPQV